MKFECALLCALASAAFAPAASAFSLLSTDLGGASPTVLQMIASGANDGARVRDVEPPAAAVAPAAEERRAFLGSALRTTAAIAGLAAPSAALLVPARPAAASDVGPVKFDAYEDAECGFRIEVPSSWERSEQKLPDRRKIVLFVDPDTSGAEDKTLLFAAYTPVRDDFTALGSFGSVDQVGQMTILPKGAIAGEETESEMLSAESKKNAYIFDYVSKVPGQPKRHFRTIFVLSPGATGGAGAVLVTLTAQTPESRYGEMKAVFDKMIDSYGKLVAKKYVL